MKHISGKRMCRILESRVWTLERIVSSHHIYSRHDHPQPISVPVHANRDMRTGTQKGIMRQAGLTDVDL